MTEQNSPDGQKPKSPFTRPAFLAAAVLVAVIVLLGLIVSIRMVGSSTPGPQSVSSTASPTSATASPIQDVPTQPSGCELGEATGEETLDSAPAATWEYEGTTAYPTSPEIGPEKVASAGYRYCFQRSAAGSLFAAANALAPPDATAARQAWIEHFVSSGPNRQKLLDSFLGEPSDTPTGVRQRIVGFRILAFSGSAARVDVATEASGSGRTIIGSYVYELAWQDGDWKLNSDAPTPFNFSSLPDVADYIPWGP